MKIFLTSSHCDICDVLLGDVVMKYDVVIAIVAKVARREDVSRGAAKQEGKISHNN